MVGCAPQNCTTEDVDNCRVSRETSPMRTVVVTGSSGAIGAAAVRRFTESGFLVVGLDRDPSALASEVFRPRAVDLRDESALDSTLRYAIPQGSLAHVVAVAGGALPQEPSTQDDAGRVPVALFVESLIDNLVTQFTTIRATLPHLRRCEDSNRSITLTSSFNAISGQGMPGYSAAKAGLIGLMYSLVAPLGSEGIRINTVAPGTIRTPRTENIWSHNPDHFDRLIESTALGRLGTPDDVAAVYFAVTTLMSHMTGHVLVVDGGQLAR